VVGERQQQRRQRKRWRSSDGDGNAYGTVPSTTNARINNKYKETKKANNTFVKMERKKVIQETYNGTI